MEVGIVGLGRMGSGIAQRLLLKNHRVVGFDTDPAAGGDLTGAGGVRAGSLIDLVDRLSPPRVVWVMLPAGSAIDRSLDAIAPRIGQDAVFVDGGNSNYKDSVRRATDLESLGVGFLDVGTSGGVRGQIDGYSMTIGGDARLVERLRPVFAALAPAPDRGWGHVGPAGTGHFVKMVHNGIEYGLMQAYAEGFAVLEKKGGLDLAGIARIWNQGSVIRSWLLELAGGALEENPSLEGTSSRVDDSGEGRWAVAEAIELDVAAPVITLALIARLASRDPDAFSNRLLQALRHEFGGHAPSQG